MPNILLTQKCIRSCPYCFARKHMHDAPPEDILKWEDLIYIVDFFQAGGDTNISLLGGEPFLHPDIVDYILYIIHRGMHVTVFTSGIVSEKILSDAIDKLKRIDPRSLGFVVNLNNPLRAYQRSFRLFHGNFSKGIHLRSRLLCFTQNDHTGQTGFKICPFLKWAHLL